MHPPSAHDLRSLPTSQHSRNLRSLFRSSNPFVTAPTTPVTPTPATYQQTRSSSAHSTISTTSTTSDNSFSPKNAQVRFGASTARTSTSSFENPSVKMDSLASILALSYPASRNASLASLSSSSSSRRPSAWGIVDKEVEREEFGASVVGMLEPRPGVGWWGFGEVLEEEQAFELERGRSL